MGWLEILGTNYKASENLEQVWVIQLEVVATVSLTGFAKVFIPK
jgi:hypothetical protein